MSFTKKTASSHVLSCTSTNNNTIRVRGSALYAEGSPTPYNAAEIQGVGDRVGRNLLNSFGYSSASITTPSSSRALTNQYGTTISTTDPENTITITQAKTANPNNSYAFVNGYFCIGINKELYGKYVKFVCDIEIIDNPLNATQFGVLPGGEFLNLITPKNGKIICSMYIPASMEKQEIEIRNCGCSMVVSNIMVVAYGETNMNYRPYGEEEKYEIPIKISGKNMLDIAGINDKGRYSATISSGVKISYDKDTQIITLNGTSTSATSTNQFVLNGEIFGDVIISAKVIGGSVSGSGYYFGLSAASYALPGDVRIQLTENGIDTTKSAGTRTPQKSGKYVVIQSNAAVTYNNFQFQLQIEEKCETPIKILIPYPYRDKTKTENGVTFTDNGDGSITVNGTATADTLFFLLSVNSDYIYAGTYTLTGCPKGGSETTYCQVLGSSDYRDFGNGITRTYAADYKQNVFIKICSGYTANNLVFRPKLVKFEDTAATEYEPYYESIEKIITLSHPLYGKDGNFDNVNFKSGKALRNVFYKELTGNEKWQQSDKYINTYYATDIMNRRAPYGHRYCSHYKEVLAPDIEVDREEKATGIMWDMIPLLIRDDNCKTIDEFKAFLKEQKDMGNPVTLVVTAANFDKPYTENIDMPTLPTIDGTTKIKIDTKIVPENVDISFYQYQDEDGE